MEKQWKKTGEGCYSFLVDGKDAGSMKIEFNTLERKAVFKTVDDEFAIKRVGLWKSNLEISNKDKLIIGKIYYQKWYASSWVFEYRENNYKLIVRNNPLAEWVIQNIYQDLLAYGLVTQNGKLGIKISSTNVDTDYLFDFLLWYQFLPIARENSGDNFLFFMMASNQ